MFCNKIKIKIIIKQKTKKIREKILINNKKKIYQEL
jgi:hypothetical protein